MNKQPTKYELEQMVNELEDTMDLQMKSVVLLAKIQRAKFLALQLEGFTELQALELCK